jgi:hypothetical protein
MLWIAAAIAPCISRADDPSHASAPATAAASQPADPMRPPRPPGSRHDPPREGETPEAPLSEAQQAELLEHLRERRPMLYQRLIELRETSPLRFRNDLRRLWRWSNAREQARGELARHRRQTIRRLWPLARQYHRSADPAERLELRERMREQIREHIRRQHERLESRLEQLREDLERFHDEIRSRVEHRGQILDRRLQWLLDPDKAPRAPSLRDIDVPGPPADSHGTPPGPPHGSPGEQPPSATADEQGLEAFAGKLFPGLDEKLRQLRESDPEGFRRALERLRSWHEHLRRMPEPLRDAVIAEHRLRVRVRQIAQAARLAADPEQREAWRDRLAETLEEVFDAEQHRLGLHLEHMRDHLRRVSDEVSRSRKRHEERIDLHLERLLERAGRNARGDDEPALAPHGR